jgi:hypothetical protein
MMSEYKAHLPLAGKHRFGNAFEFTAPLTVAAADVVRGSRPFIQEHVPLLSIIGVYLLRPQQALDGPITSYLVTLSCDDHNLSLSDFLLAQLGADNVRSRLRTPFLQAIQNGWKLREELSGIRGMISCFDMDRLETDPAKTRGAWFSLNFSELPGAVSLIRALNFVRETDVSEAAVQRAIVNCSQRRGQQFDPIVAFLGFSACGWLFTNGARLSMTLEQVQGRRRQALQLDGPTIPLMRGFVISERDEMEMEEAGAQSGGELGVTQVAPVASQPDTPQRVVEVEEGEHSDAQGEGGGGGWSEVVRGSGRKRKPGRGAGGAWGAI